MQKNISNSCLLLTTNAVNNCKSIKICSKQLKIYSLLQLTTNIIIFLLLLLFNTLSLLILLNLCDCSK